MDKVNFGVIGLGEISTRFAKVLNTVEDVTLAAVASRDLTRSQHFAKNWKAKKALPRYEDVISDPDVDIVYVGLTHNFHYEIVKKCLAAHKPVLCEKPLVTIQKQAQELVDLAREKNTLLMEAMWTRCLPAFRKAREWVHAGLIGDVKLITANFCFRMDYDPEDRHFKKELSGGSLYDVGIYPIDFTTGILCEHPQSVTGSAIIAPNGVDESAAFSMKFASGALASLTCGFNVNAKEDATIYGTAGRIVLENCFGPMTAKRFSEKGRLLETFRKLVADGFEHEIRHCADLFRAGKIESDLIPWTDTVASAAIFDNLLRQWKIK